MVSRYRVLLSMDVLQTTTLDVLHGLLVFRESASRLEHLLLWTRTKADLNLEEFLGHAS